jgi:hypothetical protein
MLDKTIINTYLVSFLTALNQFRNESPLIIFSGDIFNPSVGKTKISIFNKN